MFILRGLLIMGVLLSVTGCATYSNKKAQVIEIKTSGVDNVVCSVSNDRFKYELIAPGRIDVERNSDDYKVICRKAGYLDVHKDLKSSLHVGKAVMGNLYNGVLPGLIYDVAAESLYQYPKMVLVEMKRDPNRYIPIREHRYVVQKKQYERIASLDADKVSNKARGSSFSEEEAKAIEAIHRSIVK